MIERIQKILNIKEILNKELPNIIESFVEFYGEEYRNDIEYKLKNTLIIPFFLNDRLSLVVNEVKTSYFNHLIDEVVATCDSSLNKTEIETKLFGNHKILGDAFDDMDNSLLAQMMPLPINDYYNYLINPNDNYNKDLAFKFLKQFFPEMNENELDEYDKNGKFDSLKKAAFVFDENRIKYKNELNRLSELESKLAVFKKLSAEQLSNYNGINVFDNYNSLLEMMKKYKILNENFELETALNMKQQMGTSLNLNLNAQNQCSFLPIIYIDSSYPIDYFDQAFIHELNHCLEANLSLVNGNSIVFKNGWGTTEKEITGINMFEKNNLLLFDEIINDLIASDIVESYHKNGNCIFSFNNNSGASYSRYNFIVQPFYNKFKMDIIQSRKNNDYSYLSDKLGEEYLNQFVALIEKFSLGEINMSEVISERDRLLSFMEMNYEKSSMSAKSRGYINFFTILLTCLTFLCLCFLTFYLLN